ncbi:MAG: DUF3883 domain-containing protein [Bacteroidota bacterium]
MDLQNIIQTIQLERRGDSDAALKNIASTEKSLQQSYQGRFLFELIQNVRDTNKKANMAGAVFIELNDDILTIANTGFPFDEPGIRSITTNGDSPKDSTEFIGFKGIGFKSVSEISDCPEVVTEWGTLFFNKSKTSELLAPRVFKERETPLFFIPHFKNKKLTSQDLEQQIVTKIVLKLNKRLDVDAIEKAFIEIGVHQILLLGNLKIISLKTVNSNYNYTISEKTKTGIFDIKLNNETYSFKQFKPTHKVRIPDEILETLEDKEKEIYGNDPFIDISFVFDIDKQNNLVKQQYAKLFLFLPTKITSGFNFIIHSYFLVNPERTALRESSLNVFLLKQIADYITGEWLNQAKKNHQNTFLNFLSFQRIMQSSILEHLYDGIINGLEDKKFIFDKVSNQFFNYKDVFIADGFDKGLFLDNTLNNKRIVYIEKSDTVKWLVNEFKVDYLNWKTIEKNIEVECLKQRKTKNISFFENLYRYQIQHDDLDLKGKKVLLNNKLKLCTSDDYVIYGYKEKINLPPSIQKYIHFAHPDIKITSLGREKIGFFEFNADLLVRRILKLYDEPKVQKIDILISLLSLTISSRVIDEVKIRVLLPVSQKVKWINPLTQCVYLPSDELMQIYDISKFVNLGIFSTLKYSEEELNNKLLELGVWDVPGIYFSNSKQIIRQSDDRFRYINQNIRGFSTLWFEVYNDWFFDFPQHYNIWSTNEIIKNCNRYIKAVEEDILPGMKYRSQSSDIHNIGKNHLVALSTFVAQLKTLAWVVLENRENTLFIKDLVGIDPIEYLESSTALSKKYLNVIPIHYESKSRLISLLKLKHLDSNEISSFKEIFYWIYSTYSNNIENDKEFTLFYNKMINKLFDFYAYKLKYADYIDQLKETYFLAFNEVKNKYSFEKASKIHYIEDKSGYDILPKEIREIIQPHFTLRDKNRFGKIAKKIGLDFRKKIVQHLQDVEVLEHKKLWDWFPYFFESIVLIEDHLETNFDDLATIIKKAEIIICKSINIDLIQDGKHIFTLNDVSHKIDSNQTVKIYISHLGTTTNFGLMASVMHDFMVSVLGRELHKIRILLKDFYRQGDVTAFLNNHEISTDRIEEIKQKVGGKSFSKVQIFWSNILISKGFSDFSNYFVADDIKYSNLFEDLSLNKERDLESLCALINYENLNEIRNITPLSTIFNELNCNVVDYNKVAVYRIDFSDYHKRTFEGLKIRYKNLIEKGVYLNLLSKNQQAQMQFQNILDDYSRIVLNISFPIIGFNVEGELQNILCKKYDYIDFKNWEIPKSELNEIFKKNEIAFKKLIDNDLRSYVDDFLLLNSNRSLLYFENNIDKLSSLFKDYVQVNKTSSTTNPYQPFDLNQYRNSDDLEIEEIETNSSGEIRGTSKGRGIGGKRINGGKIGENLELIGIVGEKSVYDKLVKDNFNIEWISLNAKKCGHNPEGSDEHNCDMRFVDTNNEIHYVEVKAKSNDEKHFFISRDEYAKAILHKDNYHLYLVLYALEPKKRRILDIGNIFLLDNNNDLFNNNKFTAVFRQLEITFC